MKHRQAALAASFLCITVQASAQPATAPLVPEKPEQRTWYPRTDMYMPEDIVGSWIRYNDKTVEFIAFKKYPTGAVPKATLLNSIPVYTLTATKGDEAKAGIPGFAAVQLKDSEAQSFLITDVATVSVGEGASELFCRDWEKVLKEARDWKVGDELRYVNAALLSHVSWKIGKEHMKGADVGIEGIFNAGGKQYDQSSVSATLPAISFVTTVKEIKADDVAGKSCSAARNTGKKTAGFAAAIDFKPMQLFDAVTLLPAK